MNQRGALIIGSAFIAFLVSSAATELVLWSLKPGRIEEISWWRVQALTVWPAACAMAVASALWSRKPGWQRLDAISLAGWICVNAYLLYGLFVIVILVTEDAFRASNEHFSKVQSLALIIVLGAFSMFAGIVTTALPAFMAELAVIRFVRRRWQPVLSSGVVP